MPDRPLRVGMLTSARSWRGSATSYVHIGRGLIARGHHAHIFVSSRPITQLGAAEGIPTTELTVGHAGVRAALELRRALADHRIGILVADKPRDLHHAAAAALGSDVRVVNRFNYPEWRPPRDPLTRLAYARVNLTVFLTSGGAAFAKERVRFMTRPATTIIPEGVDIERFRPDPEAGRALRAGRGLGNGALLVAVGALEIQKHFDRVVAALARLPEPRPPLLLVGEGSQHAALASQAGAVGVEIHLPGVLTGAALAAAYNAATCFVHACEGETFGLAIAEAMSCGKPVLAVGSGAVPEVVGPAGVLVAAGDAAAFASALSALLADDSRRARLGVTARARVVGHFSLERMQAAYAAAFEALPALKRR